MIKNLTSNSPLLYVSGSTSGPYISMSNPSAGMVRYNGNTYNVEVYDGSIWTPLTSDANIGVDSRLQTVVDWAMRKMAEEAEEQRLIKEHPLLKDAHDTYRVTLELVKKHNIGEAL